MKKFLNITTYIFWAVLAVIMVCILLSMLLVKDNNRTLFGYKAYEVLSDSMKTVNGDESKGYFQAGDLILCKEVDPNELKAGDIISFISNNPGSEGKTITHMIKERVVDEEGNQAFKTYGTSTGVEDENVVTYSRVLGKFEKKASKLGKLIDFFRSRAGYILFIALPCLLLIFSIAWECVVMIIEYKKENKN